MTGRNFTASKINKKPKKIRSEILSLINMLPQAEIGQAVKDILDKSKSMIKQDTVDL